MTRKATYRIDLAKIEGEGEFLCPSCKENISPDDESGATYDVIDIKTNEEGSLEEVAILCKNCGTVIFLEGFGILGEMTDNNCSQPPEKIPFSITSSQA